MQPVAPTPLGPEAPRGLTFWPQVLTAEEAAAHLVELTASVPWERHTFTIFGKTMDMPREIQMYGPHGYHYSGVVHPPREFTPGLEILRDLVSTLTGRPFNSVLLNLYRNGRDSMGWHCDDDYAHGGQPAVASLSLGATRRFRFRARSADKPRATYGLDLTPGSLLLIDGEARTDWQHALPRTARPIAPRINLTFRHMTGS